jgi:hypothetical protein
MFKRSRLIGGLGAAAAAAVLGSAMPAMSGPAHALPVLCAVPFGTDPAPDPVRITLPNHDFGSGGLDGNEPAGCGRLTWDLANDTITPHLEGTLYAKNAIGTRVRMVLEYRDVDGTLLETQRGAAKLVQSNDVAEFPINLGAYSDPLIYRVDVELQQRINGTWDTQGTEREHVGSAAKAPDSVKITAVGQDFGDGALTNGQPTDAGTVTWDLANDTITPQLDGTLYLKNAQGTKARMRMRHYDVHGDLLRSAAGGTKEALTNGLETFPISLANYSDPEIHRVEVSLEVKVGPNWNLVGSPVTVTI